MGGNSTPAKKTEALHTDILQRLPAMTHQDDHGILMPSRWQPTTAAAAGVVVEATLVATMAAS